MSDRSSQAVYFLIDTRKNIDDLGATKTPLVSFRSSKKRSESGKDKVNMTEKEELMEISDDFEGFSNAVFTI